MSARPLALAALAFLSMLGEARAQDVETRIREKARSLLESRDLVGFDRRRLAAKILALDPDEAMGFAVREAAAADWRGRLNAVTVFSALGPKRLLAEGVGRFRLDADPNWAVRRALVEALIGRPFAETEAVLLSALRDDAAEVRLEALRTASSAGESPPDAILDLLLESAEADGELGDTAVDVLLVLPGMEPRRAAFLLDRLGKPRRGTTALEDRILERLFAFVASGGHLPSFETEDPRLLTLKHLGDPPGPERAMGLLTALVRSKEYGGVAFPAAVEGRLRLALTADPGFDAAILSRCPRSTGASLLVGAALKGTHRAPWGLESLRRNLLTATVSSAYADPRLPAAAELHFADSLGPDVLEFLGETLRMDVQGKGAAGDALLGLFIRFADADSRRHLLADLKDPRSRARLARSLGTAEFLDRFEREIETAEGRGDGAVRSIPLLSAYLDEGLWAGVDGPEVSSLLLRLAADGRFDELDGPVLALLVPRSPTSIRVEDFPGHRREVRAIRRVRGDESSWNESLARLRTTRDPRDLETLIDDLLIDPGDGLDDELIRILSEPERDVWSKESVLRALVKRGSMGPVRSFVEGLIAALLQGRQAAELAISPVTADFLAALIDEAGLDPSPEDIVRLADQMPEGSWEFVEAVTNSRVRKGQGPQLADAWWGRIIEEPLGPPEARLVAWFGLSHCAGPSLYDPIVARFRAAIDAYRVAARSGATVQALAFECRLAGTALARAGRSRLSDLRDLQGTLFVFESEAALEGLEEVAAEICGFAWSLFAVPGEGSVMVDDGAGGPDDGPTTLRGLAARQDLRLLLRLGFLSDLGSDAADRRLQLAATLDDVDLAACRGEWSRQIDRNWLEGRGIDRATASVVLERERRLGRLILSSRPREPQDIVWIPGLLEREPAAAEDEPWSLAERPEDVCRHPVEIRRFLATLSRALDDDDRALARRICDQLLLVAGGQAAVQTADIELMLLEDRNAEVLEKTERIIAALAASGGALGLGDIETYEALRLRCLERLGRAEEALALRHRLEQTTNGRRCLNVPKEGREGR